MSYYLSVPSWGQKRGSPTCRAQLLLCPAVSDSALRSRGTGSPPVAKTRRVVDVLRNAVRPRAGWGLARGSMGICWWEWSCERTSPREERGEGVLWRDARPSVLSNSRLISFFKAHGNSPQFWALGFSASKAAFQFDFLELYRPGPLTYTEVKVHGRKHTGKRGT